MVTSLKMEWLLNLESIFALVINAYIKATKKLPTYTIPITRQPSSGDMWMPPTASDYVLIISLT